MAAPAKPTRRIVWEDAPTEFTPRACVAEIYGPSNSGRTTLALTAPGPIAYIGFHEKVAGIIEPYARAKSIKTYKAGGVFIGDPDEIMKAAWERMEEFEAYFFAAFESGKFRTVIVDTHVEAWALERLAEFGAPKPDKGRVDTNWGPINARWLSLLNMARTQTETNAIFIGQVEDEWKNDAKGFGQKTGRQVKIASSAGRQVYLKSDVVFRTMVDEGGQGFSARVEKPWGNIEMMNAEITVDKDSGFPMLMSLITGTDQAEWES